MQLSRLEHKILGILRRHRWSRFRNLSMAELIQQSGGAFREVTVALINLEHGGYLHWRDKSSLRHIGLLRRAYTLRVLLPWFFALAYGVDPIALREWKQTEVLHQRQQHRVKSRSSQLRPPSEQRRSAD